jgi:predicted nucleotidyltransferase
MDIDERIRLALGGRHDICLAYLFGSCASGTARPVSDVDVAILFDYLPTPALLDRLTEDLGAATERRVDLVVLNTAPPLLAREVIAHGRFVMCRDEDERVRFVTRTTARYQDTAHLRRVQYAYLHERAEAHRAGSR